MKGHEEWNEEWKWRENEGTRGMKMKGHEEWKWRENERTHPYDPQENEGHQFDEYPGLVVLHVEEHGMLVAKGVDGAEDKSGHQGRKEGAPERLQREVVGGLWGNALIIQHFWDTKRPASASKSVVSYPFWGLQLLPLMLSIAWHRVLPNNGTHKLLHKIMVQKRVPPNNGTHKLLHKIVVQKRVPPNNGTHKLLHKIMVQKRVPPNNGTHKLLHKIMVQKRVPPNNGTHKLLHKIMVQKRVPPNNGTL